MKRASSAILALLVVGCHSSPTFPAKAPIEPERTSMTAAGYTFARQRVLEDLARRPNPDEAGWTIPTTSFEASIVRDNFDHRLYFVTFSGSKTGFAIRSWTVTLRRTGEDWTLVKIEETGRPGQPSLLRE